jgi:hypothetical protein
MSVIHPRHFWSSLCPDWWETNEDYVVSKEKDV